MVHGVLTAASESSGDADAWGCSVHGENLSIVDFVEDTCEDHGTEKKL